MKEKHNAPHGIFTASLTPLKRDYSIDHQLFCKHCNWLLENGCDGLVILGTTGEANSFSVAERMEALKAIIKSGISANKLIVGTGCCSFRDTLSLTQHAVNLGVMGVLVLPPFFYKEIDDEGLYEYFKMIINKTDNPELKILLYNIPQLTGIRFSHGFTERLSENYPDTIVGIKDSSGDWDYLNATFNSFPKLRIIPGTEKYLLDILQMGGYGCISATANITCGLAAEIYKRWNTDDISELNEKMLTIRQMIESFPLIPALKAVISEWTNRSAWKHVRPPHIELDEKTSKELMDKLQRLDSLN